VLNDLLTYAVLLKHPLAVSGDGRVQWAAWSQIYRRGDIVASAAVSMMRRTTATLSTVREHTTGVVLGAAERAAYDQAREAECRQVRHHQYAVEAHAALTRLRRALSGCGIEMRRIDARIQSMPIVERAADDTCPVCYEYIVDGMVPACGHHFCRGCMVGWLDGTLSGTCPMCRQHVVAGGGMRRSTKQEAPAAAAPPPRIIAAKLGALREVVERGTKTIVFVAFAETMGAIRDMLGESVRCYEITGSMSHAQRRASVTGFRDCPTSAVFLMTPRTGATGLNLQCASTVVIFEPSLNPEVEKQALGRVVRIGQSESVDIYRLVTQGTVEEAIVRHRTRGSFRGVDVREILECLG
jgi:hypothetical protein